MPQARIRGVVAAIPTPITDAGEPDHVRLMALARKLLANGCDGLNLLGTTGEATSFTVEQRMGVMSAAADSGLPLDRLMVGTGAAAVGDAVRLSQHAAALGFAGVLVLPPFYYKGVPDTGVVDYIRAIVDATATSAIPVYLYNFPALSGVPYTVALVTELVRLFDMRIAGLKDSSGDLPYARAVAAIAPTLDVFPSSEVNLLEARTGIFAGCISATASLNAPECARAFHQGDAAALARAAAIRAVFDGQPLIPGIKLLLADSHGDPALAATKPPLGVLTDIQVVTLRERYAAIQAVPAGALTA
jgi:4-hydroxy-tetrahydrodipicolinate synthase